jgi:hypothetical protein
MGGKPTFAEATPGAMLHPFQKPGALNIGA